jgi:hypothetical protein
MKSILTVSVFLVLFSLTGFSQSDRYFTSGADMIFSFADINDNGTSGDNLMRWVPVINIQTHYNIDMSEKFGLFLGLGIRNVGYIYDGYTDPVSNVVYKKKFRSYNLGIPVGLKIGRMSGTHVYAGYEIEFPFVYKEKTFDGSDKISKITGWFSDRQETFQHGFFVGMQFADAGNIKFRYYLTEFHNQDFTDSSGNKPYAGLESNIFYFSVGYMLYRD